MGERLGRLRARVADRWMTYAPAERTQIIVVMLCSALYLGHYFVFCLPQPFFIEDSAISFAYARHLADGEGLVAYPGGERVEGYSNALWTFLIAAFYLIGIPVWTTPKVLGGVFGVLTLFFAWGLARRARPEAQDSLAVLAPFLLACSTQFVLWNGSGLENSLFNVLLAAGMWALVREIQDGHPVPWSAFAFFGLSMTRPDGVAYAAIGLFGRILGTLANRQWRALPVWVLAFGLPYAAYNAWRYDYFAWWFPNTYYAKEKVFRPFGWTQGGWKQVKEYATQYGIVYAAPLVVIALTGLSTWRKWVGAFLLAIYAVFLLWDGRAGIPSEWTGEWSRLLSRNWNDARIWYLLGGSALLGLVTFGRKGWEARGLLWAAFCAGVFFCVWSGGDWMKGLRWFSMTSVPLFTLLAVGIGALVVRLPFASRAVAGWMPVKVLFATPIAIALAFPNVNGSWTFANKPETAPRDVYKRVRYMTWVQNRLGLENVTLMDVDMGAHMWWSGWDIVDIAGLVDMPIAHHKKYHKKFITEYVFEERQPDFAHVHGSWARTSKIHLNERWNEYIEIPGYPSGRRSLHVGNHVRKEHFVTSVATGPAGRQVSFGGGVTLEGWDVPSAEVAAGGELYVTTSWRAEFPEPVIPEGPEARITKTAKDSKDEEPKNGFRVLAFLVNAAGLVHVAEVAPGYDWYAPDRWQDGELVRGDWGIPLPESLPEGTYDFGFVVLDQTTGAVLPYLPAAAAGTTEASLPAAPTEAAPPAAPAARFMAGEWRSKGLVRIVAPVAVLAAAEADYERALALAEAGDCEGAGTAFRDARRHVARNERWYESRVDGATTARVHCLVNRAAGSTDLMAQARVLAEARELDHRNDKLIEVAVPLAQRLVKQGDSARAAEDWGAAYRAYSAALSIDATLSWTRRAAEEVRDLRLGIDPAKPDSAAPRKPTSKPPKLPKSPEEKPGDIVGLGEDGVGQDGVEQVGDAPAGAEKDEVEQAGDAPDGN